MEQNKEQPSLKKIIQLLQSTELENVELGFMLLGSTFGNLLTELLEVLLSRFNTLRLIESLPETYNYLLGVSKITLRIVNLGSMNLKVTPANVFKLDHLIDLRLNNNEIADIPKEISQLHDLQAVDFNQNNIVSLPSGIEFPAYLEVFNISNNPIVENEDEMRKLRTALPTGCKIITDDLPF